MSRYCDIYPASLNNTLFMSADYFNQMIGHVLRPLVRITLRFGGTFPSLRDELKRAFFDVANADNTANGKAPTDSRIAIITGLHRKEIREFRKNETAHDVVVPLSAQIQALWSSDLIYLNADGDPMPLPLKRSVGKERSFEALVERVSKNIRSRTVLDQFLANEEATINRRGEVELSAQGLNAHSDEERKIFEVVSFTSESLQLFSGLRDGDRKNFAANFFSSLTEDAADELYLDARRAINQVRSKLNLQGTEHEEKSREEKLAKQRVYLGFFQIKTDQDRSPELHAVSPALKPETKAAQKLAKATATPTLSHKTIAKKKPAVRATRRR